MTSPRRSPIRKATKFTLDLALINNAGGTLTGTVCGVGQSNTITDRFTHWMVATDPNDSNKLKFWFKLDNGTVETIDITNAAITDANLHRITVQLDLGSTAGPGQTVNYPQGAAWFDGTQTQLITLPNKLGSWAPANYSSTNGGTEDTPYVFQITGNQLWKYEQAPFQLGSMGNGALGTVTSSGVSWTQQHVDWTFCGLAESKLCRYTWGATLTRADSGTINDSWRFFSSTTGTPGALASLPLTDNPSSANYPAIGTVETWSGYNIGAGWGLWLPERTRCRTRTGSTACRILP